MALIAPSENVQRKQLTSIEVVRAHKRALNETELTVQALADQLDMSRPNLANNLRVLELPGVVLEHVESGTLSLSVAREFLVLQHAGHVHLEDIQQIVITISSVYGRRGAPDWSRRHVRQRIYERVTYNEKDWRPLGPKPQHTIREANKEATFDTEAFKAAFPESLHTVPAVSEYKVVNYEAQLICDGSRLWTCQVKEWSRWQSRATREANREIDATGDPRGTPSNRTPSRDEQLSDELSTDPVWRRIRDQREKEGPDKPLSDEERQQLGTRTDLHDVSYNTKLWKLLEKAQKQDVDWAGTPRWADEAGGPVPPFFLDLKECQQCTAGAVYAKSRGSGPLSKPTLVCLNKSCYDQKCETGAAVYREKMEAHKKGIYRENRELAMRYVSELAPLSAEALRALATSLLHEMPRFEMQHPFGVWHENWIYEAGATAKARELLGIELRTGWRGPDYLEGKALATLDHIDPGDLR